jgi:muramidase (phage lysozyme)
VQDYGISKQTLIATEQRRAEELAGTAAETEFQRLQGNLQRATADQRNGAQLGAQGITNAVDSQFDPSFEEFIAATNLTPAQQESYRGRFESFRQNILTDTYAFEFEQGSNLQLQQIDEAANEAAIFIHNQPLSFDQKLSEMLTMVDNSGLPAPVIEETKKLIENRLMGAIWQTEQLAVANDTAPAGPADGSRPVAPNLTPMQAGLLQTIAGPESGGQYNVIYGGASGNQYFSDYSDHPRQRSVIPGGPNAGRTSDAAGRYQFLSSTWDEVVGEMNRLGYNIQDFSPASQDKAALYLAQRNYRRETGQDLFQVLASGNREAIAGIRGVLAPTWEGFVNMSDDAFANFIMGGRGMQAGGTGTSTMPDMWTDPRFAGLTFEERVQYSQQNDIIMEQQRQTDMAAYAAQQQALFDQVREAASRHDPRTGMLLEAQITSGQLTDVDKIVAARGLVDAERQNYNDTRTVDERMASGSIFSAVDDSAINSWAERNGIYQQLSTPAERDAGNASLQQLFARTQRIPEQALQILGSLSTSTNPADRLFAMESLANLYSTNMRAAAGAVTPEVLDQMILAKALIESSASPEAAIARQMQLQLPENAHLRTALMTQFDQALEDNGDLDLVSKMQTFWERNVPFYEGIVGIPPTQAPTTPFDNARFRSESMDLVRTFYLASGGDFEGAMKAAVETMQANWGPSPIDGGLMRYAPTAPAMGVQPIAQSFDWIEDQVRTQVAADDETQVLIMADERTLPTPGVPPSYAIVLQDENGMMTLSPERFVAEPSAKTLQEEQVRLRIVAAESERDRILLLDNPRNPEAVRADARRRAAIAEARITTLRASVGDGTATQYTVTPPPSANSGLQGQLEQELADLILRRDQTEPGSDLFDIADQRIKEIRDTLTLQFPLGGQ